MSDERLRELERRWKETGSVEDGAQWLLARMRGGSLDPLRLRVAAFSGEEAARVVLADDFPLMTTREIAGVYGFTQQTIRSWTDFGCPFERSGRAYRFDPGAVLRWAISTTASSLDVQAIVNGCAIFSEEAGWAAAIEAARLAVSDKDGSAESLGAFSAWLDSMSDALADAALAAADWHPETPLADLAAGIESVRSGSSPWQHLRKAVATALADYAYHPAHTGLDAYAHRGSKEREFLEKVERGVTSWALA